MPQFDRVIRLTVGQPGGGGVVIENLRMTFDIEKDPTDTTNKCKVKIYNLAPKTRQAVEKDDINYFINKMVPLERKYINYYRLEKLKKMNFSKIKGKFINLLTNKR